MTTGTEATADAGESNNAGIDPQLLITYRYLRMSMVAVLAMLAAAVAIEWGGPGETLLTSISAYYWTPVGAAFVGALVALGIGMLVLKPDNELEDILLNIAGVLAPVVAFVPTPDSGTCQPIASGDFVGAAQVTVDGIKNNVLALFVAGLIGFAILVLFSFVLPEKAKFPPLTPAAKVARWFGLGAMVVLFAGAVVWFNKEGTSFECHAHDAAAFTLFGCIVGVAILNAVSKFVRSAKEDPDRNVSWINRYSVLAFLMLVVLGIGLARQSWDYWVLFVEVGVLSLFISFWFLQSLDLWNRVPRSPSDERPLLPK